MVVLLSEQRFTGVDLEAAYALVEDGSVDKVVIEFDS